MINELLHYSGVQGVRHIEHVVSVATTPFWIRAGEVLLHVLQGHQLLVEVLDGELIILRHNDHLHVLLPDEQLLLSEDILGVVFGEHRERAYIILPN